MKPPPGALAIAAFLLAPIAVPASLFLSPSAHAQQLNDAAHRFLQRQGVPCQLVLKVGSLDDLGEVATCQDGREWVLFWIEGEIAFVHPRTREPYRWNSQIYRAHPELFSGPQI